MMKIDLLWTTLGAVALLAFLLFGSTAGVTASIVGAAMFLVIGALIGLHRAHRTRKHPDSEATD